VAKVRLDCFVTKKCTKVQALNRFNAILWDGRTNNFSAQSPGQYRLLKAVANFSITKSRLMDSQDLKSLKGKKLSPDVM